MFVLLFLYIIHVGIMATGSLSLISKFPVLSLTSGHVERASAITLLHERSTSTYTIFSGDGEVSDGWPSISDWMPNLETMFDNNRPILTSSCAQWNVPDNTDDEINDIYNSILSVARSTGIDARFILAIIMQESNGCVRAPTTNYGVRNPGLMQSHNGAGTCNDDRVQSPCPSDEITQMVQDGSAGTSSGDGLKQCLAKSGATDTSMYYKAARIYNSGSIAASGNLGAGITTACYATDIANRLTGWFSGPSGCEPGTIGQLTGFATKASTTSLDAVPAVPTILISAAITSSITAAPVSIPSVAVSAYLFSATEANNGLYEPLYPWATTSCQQWYTVQPGDYCFLIEQKFSISMAQLMSWNAGLDVQCLNLWLAYQYCVKA